MAGRGHRAWRKGCLVVVVFVLLLGLSLLAVNNPNEADLREEISNQLNSRISENARSGDGFAALAGLVINESGLMKGAIETLPIKRTNFLILSRFDIDVAAIDFLDLADEKHLCLIGIMGQFISCDFGSGTSSKATSDEPSETNLDGEESDPSKEQVKGDETASSDAPNLGRCHMEECSWNRVLESTVLSQERNAVLIEQTLLGGTSPFEEGDTDEARITWNAAPHKIWVMCSPFFPAVAIKTGNEYQVDVLDIRTISGVQQSAANIYSQACEEDLLSQIVVNRYARIPWGSQSLTIEDPSELVVLARDAMNSIYRESDE